MTLVRERGAREEAYFSTRYPARHSGNWRFHSVTDTCEFWRFPAPELVVDADVFLLRVPADLRSHGLKFVSTRLSNPVRSCLGEWPLKATVTLLLVQSDCKKPFVG